jgi:hypothetical protein
MLDRRIGDIEKLADKSLVLGSKKEMQSGQSKIEIQSNVASADPAASRGASFSPTHKNALRKLKLT